MDLNLFGILAKKYNKYSPSVKIPYKVNVTQTSKQTRVYMKLKEKRLQLKYRSY